MSKQQSDFNTLAVLMLFILCILLGVLVYVTKEYALSAWYIVIAILAFTLGIKDNDERY